jgi:hypothetical protein
MTTATMVYDYPRERWTCFAVRLVENVLPTCDYIERMLTDAGNYLYPNMVDAPIDWFEYKNGQYSVEFSHGFELPEVVTLEQSIENNRKFLATYC